MQKNWNRSEYQKWYWTQRWKRRRKAQLQREPLCRTCKALGHIVSATVADHVVPHKGDEHSFWYGELQSLCDTHHNSDKKRIEAGKQILGCDVNGNPLSNQSHWNDGDGQVRRSAGA